MVSRYILWVLLMLPSDWKNIAITNEAIDIASRSFKEADYENSVRNHLALIDEHGLNQPEIKFNLALSYQNNGQEEDAKKTYEALANNTFGEISSFASNQQGVMLGNEKKYKEALAYFKTALLNAPDNEKARYNYELLSRWLEGNEENQENEENQDQEDKPEPSNYAKRMKAQADDLVDRFQFEEALNTMNRALEIDETVASYQQFIDHLKDIDEINK
ncbi:tetratricopeptide repeat protein [uncultured Cyclobacterium sp.]|uniref:tetratricopeptide repeat protein n=1 Tax=uncultured Cyclobacterium sp. TaxID=453820 RepID=UPI0030EC300A